MSTKSVIGEEGESSWPESTKHQGAETRHEGASAFHEHGDPGPGGCNLGEAVLASVRHQLLPNEAVAQLIREAEAGSLPALCALQLSITSESAPELPASLADRVVQAVDAGDQFVAYVAAMHALTLGDSTSDEILTRGSIKALRKASHAGVAEATWLLSRYDAKCGKRDRALALARQAKSQGCLRAAEAVAFFDNLTALTPLVPAGTVDLVTQLRAEQESECRILKDQIAALKVEVEAQTARADAAVSTRDDRVAKDETVKHYAFDAEAAKRELVRVRELLAEQTRLTKKVVTDSNEFKKKSESEFAALKRVNAYLEENLRRREARRAGN